MGFDLGLKESQVGLGSLFFDQEPLDPFFLDQGVSGADFFPRVEKIADDRSKEDAQDDDPEEAVLFKIQGGVDPQDKRAQEPSHNRAHPHCRDNDDELHEGAGAVEERVKAEDAGADGEADTLGDDEILEEAEEAKINSLFYTNDYGIPDFKKH